LKSIKTSFDEDLNMNEMEMKARLIVDDIKNEEGTSPAFKNGIKYVNEHYDVKLEYEEQECEFYSRNQQCIREKCPFYPA